VGSSGYERRGTPRYAFAATATLTTSEGAESFPVQVLGIGLAGCRISTPQPLPRGEEFDLTIDPEGAAVVARVETVYCRPTGLAGLHFTLLSADAQWRLEQLTQYLERSAAALEGPGP